jgi:hypothetical protein
VTPLAKDQPSQERSYAHHSRLGGIAALTAANVESHVLARQLVQIHTETDRARAVQRLYPVKLSQLIILAGQWRLGRDLWAKPTIDRRLIVFMSVTPISKEYNSLMKNEK